MIHRYTLIYPSPRIEYQISEIEISKFIRAKFLDSFHVFHESTLHMRGKLLRKQIPELSEKLVVRFFDSLLPANTKYPLYNIKNYY